MGLTVLGALACLHAGFQLTVTVLVYPALADVPDERWDAAHARHSRRIVPLVVLTYGALVVAGVVVLVVTGPGEVPAWLVLAGAVALLGVLGVTAFAAAPLHGRLDDAQTRPALVRRLLVVDRVRAVLAVVAAAAFVAASLV